ncbi:hypothetical protein Oweho_0103 [Owenweeksia hongkongensis DSM 17368]|uniref:MetA-pathway of phenol degradation n=1 Tax=Owenweeksia hongkongensis (strain DSM 17368 / CIP 108786 / JCM 12287 / NRRL B-23963 / UST20020801) TaxID=926562 RepID=G8R5X7_OWEHD|nr:transporter [Owenweeksia hongkongensis]AEV31125.1 hypothetical protein Oweho_0103 [Owenweeksia hongkongensis DSM 17368]
MINKFLNRSRLVLLFVFAFSGIIQAQYNETIRTGRPGQSINPFTTGKGILQFQQGYVYDQEKADIDPNTLSLDRDGIAKNSTFENVIRYGIAENIEINAAVDYKWENWRYYSNLPDEDIQSNYLSTFDIGARMHLVGQNKGVPDIAVQARLGMGQYFQNGEFEVKDVKITGAFAWQLTERNGLTVNIIPIIDIAGFESSKINYTLAYSYAITDKLGVFIENYGTIFLESDVNNGSYEDFRTYFDGGFSYLISNNVQLDILGGYGYNRPLVGTPIESYFVSAGISWRILTAK